MKINQIEIKRFRSILDLKISIDQDNNLSTICGANNSGKTNVLKALNLFFNPHTYKAENDAPNHKFYGSRGGATYPEITLQFVSDIYETKIKRIFNIDGLDKTSGSKKEIGSRSKTSLDDVEIEKIFNQIAFFFIPAINISFPELINNLIDDVYDLEYQRTRFQGLKKDLKESFENYIGGLVEILNQLADEINPTFQNFNNNWSVAFSNTADVKKFKDLISEDIEFYLNDKSNHNIQGKGSGLQRLGYILLHGRIIDKLKKKSVIFCVDEPDVFLHQGLQKKLRDYLESIATTQQVIITTHSPTFIDSYRLKNVFLLDLEIGEDTYYKRADMAFNPLNTCLIDISEDNGMKKIREYLGISMEDFDLLENYNVIVEGDSDVKYLSEICHYFNIEIPKLISSDGATKIEKYLDFYSSFYSERDFKPSILVILDNDKAGRDEYKKLNKKLTQNAYPNLSVKLEFIPNCFGDIPSVQDVLHDRISSNYEIEDFVYPELLLKACNALLRKINFKTVSFGDLNRKLTSRSFKEKGVLYNIDLLKNEKNPDEGHRIDFSGEQAKKGMAGLFNIKGDKRVSDQMTELSIKYPQIKIFLERVMDSTKF